MKILINRANPAIRISAPDEMVKNRTNCWAIWSEGDRMMLLDKDNWTLVEKEENISWADKLKAEIERLYDGEAPKHDQQCDFDDGYFTGIGVISKFIDSLQQEQPKAELDADIKMEWDSFNKHVAEYGKESEEVVWLNWPSFVDVATYFYELGLKAKKEK